MDRVGERLMDGSMDRWIDGSMDRWIDGSMDRPIEDSTPVKRRPSPACFSFAILDRIELKSLWFAY